MINNQKLALTKTKKRVFKKNVKQSQKGKGILFPVKLFGTALNVFGYYSLIVYPIVHYLIAHRLPNSYTKIPSKIFTSDIFKKLINQIKKKGFFQSKNIQLISNQYHIEYQEIIKEFQTTKNQIEKDKIIDNKLKPKLDQIYFQIEKLITQINKKKVILVKNEINLEISKYNLKHHKSGSQNDLDFIRNYIKKIAIELQDLESILLIYQNLYQFWILNDKENYNILNQKEKEKYNNYLKDLLNQKNFNQDLVSEKIRLEYTKKLTTIPYHSLLSRIQKILLKISIPRSISLLYFQIFKFPFFHAKYKFLQQFFGIPEGIINIDTVKKLVNQQFTNEKYEEAKKLLQLYGIIQREEFLQV